jgi:hypothetical protein
MIFIETAMREPLIRVKIFETCALSHFSTFLFRLLLPAIMALIMGWSLLINYCTAIANTNTTLKWNNVREAEYTGAKQRSEI